MKENLITEALKITFTVVVFCASFYWLTGTGELTRVSILEYGGALLLGVWFSTAVGYLIKTLKGE